MLKLVPIVAEAGSRDLGSFDRRNIFLHHGGPSLTNCNQVHNQAHFNQSPLTQCVWTFFWLAILLFCAYPIGLLAGQLYLFISPLAAIPCCKCCVTDILVPFLLKALHLPQTCTTNMIKAKALVTI